MCFDKSRSACFKLHVTDAVLEEVGCKIESGLDALVLKLRAAALSPSADDHTYSPADASATPGSSDPTIHMVGEVLLFYFRSLSSTCTTA